MNYHRLHLAILLIVFHIYLLSILQGYLQLDVSIIVVRWHIGPVTACWSRHNTNIHTLHRQIVPSVSIWLLARKASAWGEAWSRDALTGGVKATWSLIQCIYKPSQPDHLTPYNSSIQNLTFTTRLSSSPYVSPVSRTALYKSLEKGKDRE
jgi:hypothetical protein